MCSSIRSIVLVAIAAFMIVADAHQGQIIDGLRIRSSAGGNKFKDTGYTALRTLGEGPYPSVLSAVKSVPPMVPGTSGFESLLKRTACDCGTGFGCCGSSGTCCPTTQLCASTGGCCDIQFKYTCGGLYCCPYASCTTDGRCGCPAKEARCGDDCCLYGCAKDNSNTCACPPGDYIACTEFSTCCPGGTTCAGPGKCMPPNATNVTTTPATPLPTSLPTSLSTPLPTPLPTSPSAASNTSSLGQSSGSSASASSFSPPSAASSMERSGAMVALMMVAITFLLV